MLAIEPRRRLDIVAGDGGRRRPDILVFGGLLNESAFKGRSAEGLFTTMLSPVSNAAWEGVSPSSTPPLSPSRSPSFSSIPPSLPPLLFRSFVRRVISLDLCVAAVSSNGVRLPRRGGAAAMAAEAAMAAAVANGVDINPAHVKNATPPTVGKEKERVREREEV